MEDKASTKADREASTSKVEDSGADSKAKEASTKAVKASISRVEDNGVDRASNKVVVITSGSKTLSTSSRDGEKEVISRCHSGRTKIMYTFHPFNSTEVAKNAMELELLTDMELLLLAEIVTGNKAYVLNVSVEEPTILMENLVINVREENGRKKEDTAVPAAVPVMEVKEVKEDNGVKEEVRALISKEVVKDLIKEVKDLIKEVAKDLIKEVARGVVNSKEEVSGEDSSKAEDNGEVSSTAAREDGDD